MDKHKMWVRSYFDNVALEYGQDQSNFYDYFAEALVYYSSLSEGEIVLDVATGKGAVASAAAKIVGPKGHVFGIDLSEKMVIEASKKKALDWLEYTCMDAESLSFKQESFDAVFCAFGLNLFSNPMQALSEIKRVLKTDGCLALSLWGKRPPLEIWLAGRAKTLGAKSKLHTLTVEKKETIFELLEKAGFGYIEIDLENKSFEQSDLLSWWHSLGSLGLGALLEQLTPDIRDQLQKEAFAKASELKDTKGKLHIERQVLYVVAEKLG